MSHSLLHVLINPQCISPMAHKCSGSFLPWGVVVESKIVKKLYLQKLKNFTYSFEFLPMDVPNTNDCIQSICELQEMHPLPLKNTPTYTLENVVFLHCSFSPQYMHHIGYGAEAKINKYD